MENIAVRKGKELDPAARAWVRTLFGREISADENITVLVFPPHASPSDAERQTAIARMDQLLAEADRRTKGVPSDELDEALDEAMQHVRQWKP